jgi:hypothetical protein
MEAWPDPPGPVQLFVLLFPKTSKRISAAYGRVEVVGCNIYDQIISHQPASYILGLLIAVLTFFISILIYLTTVIGWIFTFSCLNTRNSLQRQPIFFRFMMSAVVPAILWAIFCYQLLQNAPHFPSAPEIATEVVKLLPKSETKPETEAKSSMADERQEQSKAQEEPKIEPKKSKSEEKPKQTAPKGEQKAEEYKPESAKVQPDISARLISKKELTVALINVSPPGIVVRDPKLTLVIWDLDLPDHDEPLPEGRVITKTFDGKWIRQEEIFIVIRFTRVPEVAALIKPGHRLFGWMTVTCPDCIRTKAYWIYTIHGEGGWYTEIQRGYPQLDKVKALLPQIRDDPETFFSANPKESRIVIEDLP